MDLNNLPSLTRHQLFSVGLGLSSALLFWGLKPRYRAETAVVTYPSLAGVKRSAASVYALQLYPKDFYPGGEYVTLPMGKIRYWLFGPEDGEKVVLVHGFMMPAIVWKDVANGLADAGFRVLLYDHYGRGHSDAPQTDYSTTLYVTQLALLLQHVGWEKVSPVGYSMGGAITAAFTRTFPWMVSDRVVLIAPAGVLKKSDFKFSHHLATSRVVSYIASSSIFRFFRRRSLKITSVPAEHGARVAKLLPAQAAVLPGYLFALSSSLINGPFRNQRDAFISLSSRRVLMVFGKVDATVPFRCALEINELIEGSELLTVEDAGHNVPMSHAKIVTHAIVAHLKA